VWDEKLGCFQLNKTEFLTMVKKSVETQKSEIEIFRKENSEIFSYFKKITGVKNFGFIKISEWIEICVNGIISKKQSSEVGESYKKLGVENSEQSFLSYKSSIAKIICYFCAKCFKNIRENDDYKNEFEKMIDQIDYNYDFIKENVKLNKSLKCSKKNSKFFKEEYFLDKNFEPYFFFRNICENSIEDIVVATTGSKDACSSFERKETRIIKLFSVIVCIMLNTGCRIQSIYKAGIEVLGQSKFCLSIGKKKKSEDEKFEIEYENVGFVVKCCQKMKFDTYDFNNIFTVDLDGNVKFKMSVTTIVKKFLRICNVENINVKDFEFVNCILRDTHVLRNWAINKLLLDKLNPWEVACLTGQTVKTIVECYQCELVAEINEKRGKAKVQASLDRRGELPTY
jgi:hypothetical protein